jgi:P-type Ca2+ transporter type 2C
MTPFSSERKAIGVVVRIRTGGYRLLLKGASEILTKKCTHHVIVSREAHQSQHADSEIEAKAIDEFSRDNISRTIIFSANQKLRTIALCYPDFWRAGPTESDFQSDDEVSYEYLSRNLTLVAITGIEDPLRLVTTW